MAAVADLIDAEPLELKRRGKSLTAMEGPGGSWPMGKIHSNRPAERTSDTSTHSGSRMGDFSNRGVSLDVGCRRSSLSMLGPDAAAFRSSLRAGPVSIHALAGVVRTSHACLPRCSMHPHMYTLSYILHTHCTLFHTFLHACIASGLLNVLALWLPYFTH